MKTREFHLGDILSITTGRLVSPRHIEGVYDILNFMTGDNLFTHQLPRASGACKPFLLKQHPQLVGVDASSVNKDNWEKWLAEQVYKHGKYLKVKPIPKGEYLPKNPIEELRELAPKAKIVIVETGKTPKNL